MNILLTNDDGIHAEGIAVLRKKLAKYGRVVVIAPDGPRSGKSASLTLGTPIFINKKEDDVYSCSGTPVDCVSFGLTSLDIKFDLVVSGCNDGWNVSYDTIYSGTIGACLEAVMIRTKAIAFSTNHDFEIVDKYFDKVWDYVFKHNLVSNQYLLNINFPLEDVKDIKLAKEYYRKDTNYFTQGGDGYMAYRYMQVDFSDQKDTDCYLLTHNTVTITPLGKTYYSSELFNQVQKLIKN